MKTLNFYVVKNFVTTLVVAIGVLTFGMLGVHLIKIFEYIARGIPLITALTFFQYVIPFALSLTIPFGVLVSVMLIFGRMSADKEIMAMRACGISILQIISPIIIITFFLTCACLVLQIDLGPRLIGEARNLVKKAVVTQPMALIEPGIPIRHNNLFIFVGAKKGEKNISDIQVFQVDNDGSLRQDVTASHGSLEADLENRILNIVLEEATIISYDKETNQPRRAHMGQLKFPIRYGEKFSQMKLVGRINKLPLREMLGMMVLRRKSGKDTTALQVELNKRIVLALSPIAFMLIGMPLAIRTSRRETSVGLLLSVVLAGVYFIGIMICPSLDSHPECYPQFLIWIPNIAYQIFGAFYLFKIATR